MRFGAAHTPRRNMVKPIIAAMRESVKYISCISFCSGAIFLSRQVLQQYFVGLRSIKEPAFHSTLAQIARLEYETGQERGGLHSVQSWHAAAISVHFWNVMRCRVAALRALCSSSFMRSTSFFSASGAVGSSGASMCMRTTDFGVNSLRRAAAF